MDKTITAISRFGSCSVLIVRAKANMDPLFSKFQVLHSQAQDLADPKSTLFEHETQQAIPEARRIAIRVLPHVNTVDEGLEILLRHNRRESARFFQLQFHALDDSPTSARMCQQVTFGQPFASGDIHV